MGQFECVCISCLLVLLLVIFNNLPHLKSSPVRNPLVHTLQSTVISNMEAKHIHEKWNLSPQSIRSIVVRCSEKPRMALSHKEWVHMGQKTPSIKENLQPHRDYTG